MIQNTKVGNYDGAVEVINKIAPRTSRSPKLWLTHSREPTRTLTKHTVMKDNQNTEHTQYDYREILYQENPVSDADAEAVKQAIIKNKCRARRTRYCDGC